MKLPSTKRLQVNKANTTVVVAASIASFVTVFALVSSYALWNQRGFQSRVVEEKQIALDQMEANVEAASDLETSYKVFVESSDRNIIGGSARGEGERDGDNAQIILDALPSKYDFPAVATSVEKILTDLNLRIDGISGDDDEVAQQDQESDEKPEAVTIPFGFEVSGSVDGMTTLIEQLERSIRPIQITELTITSIKDAISLEVKANTFYQPETGVRIDTKVVR